MTNAVVMANTAATTNAAAAAMKMAAICGKSDEDVGGGKQGDNKCGE